MILKSLEQALIDYPKLKKPLIGGIIIWTAMLVAAGVVIFVIGYEDHVRTRTVQKVQVALTADHNISACTFRVLLTGIRNRAQQQVNDPTTTTTARNRALQSIRFYDQVIAGQVTEPTDVNCVALLAKLSKTHTVPSVVKTTK